MAQAAWDDERESALTRAILSAAFAAMQPGPGGAAAAIGRAGMFGLGAYDESLNAAQKRRLMEAQMIQEAQQAEARALQIEGARRSAQFDSRADDIARQYFRAPDEPADGMGPTLPGRSDLGGYAKALAGLGTRGVEKSLAIQAAMAKESPWAKLDPKDYTPASLKKFAATGDPTDLTPREKIVADNLGGKTVYRSEYDPTPVGSAARTMTPGEAWQASKDRMGDVREVTMPDGTTQLARVGMDNRPVPIMGTGQKRERLHDAAAEKLLTLDEMAAKASTAREGVKNTPSAIGPMNAVTPSWMMNMKDTTAEIDTRARLSELSTFILNARSGAAVTDAEYKRLEPFLATPNDSPKSADTKLQNLSRMIESLQAGRRSFYASQGYRVPDAAPSVDTTASRLGDGQSRAKQLNALTAELARREREEKRGR